MDFHAYNNLPSVPHLSTFLTKGLHGWLECMATGQSYDNWPMQDCVEELSFVFTSLIGGRIVSSGNEVISKTDLLTTRLV